MQHVERLGQTRCRERLAFDDGLIGAGTTGDIIGLDGEDLLEHMCGTVCLECPNLHLTETLTTELCLTAERLLGDEAVRTDGTRVHLIVNHVTELHEVGHTDGSHLVEGFACLTVIELGLTATRQACFVGPLVELLHGTTVEDRGAELDTELLSGPTEDSLEDLTDIHTGRHTHRVEDDIYRRTIREERHVLYADDLGNDTLVTVTTGHLITYADLTTLCDIDLGHLDDTVGQLVTDGEVELIALELRIHLLIFRDIIEDTLRYKLVLMLIVGPFLEEHREEVDLVEALLGEVLPLGDEFGTHDILDGQGLTTIEHGVELLDEQIAECVSAFAELEVHLLHGLLIFHLLLAVFVGAAVEFLIDDDTVEGRAALEGGILDVSGFITEDSLEELLLRTRIGLAFRRDLTDEDITRLHVGTDTDETVLVEVLRCILGNVRDVGRELLHTALGVAHLEQLLYDVYGSVHILTNDTLGEDDGILVVVTFPRDVRHLEVLTERQFAASGSITLGEHLTFDHLIALANDRMEVDGGILVGLLELRHLVLFLCQSGRT